MYSKHKKAKNWQTQLDPFFLGQANKRNEAAIQSLLPKLAKRYFTGKNFIYKDTYYIPWVRQLCKSRHIRKKQVHQLGFSVTK